MSNSRALLLLPLAAVLLALAVVDGGVVAAFQAIGVEGEAAASMAPLASASAAAVGFVLLVVVLFAVVANHTRAERARPYRAALRSFAAEFGRAVDQTPDGLRIDAMRDGQRVEVLLDPRAGGLVVVRSVPPARQSLSWTATSAETPPPARGWREVEQAENWRMHAELPVMARPLLADGALMDVIARFFKQREARHVTHTLSGIVVQAALPPPENADVVVRLCAEIAFRLRRVNG